MLQIKNWGKSTKIGDVIIWITLMEALNWRRKHGPDISNDQAFNELRSICSPEHAKAGEQWLVWASGKQTGWRPTCGWRSANLPEYRPFEDPPVHDRDALPIPAEQWPDLGLSSPEGITTGNLDWAYERTPAWGDVHFPRDELIAVWRPLFGKQRTRPKPTSEELDEWMSENVRHWGKRDQTIKACREDTGATVRDAAAAFGRLPADRTLPAGARHLFNQLVARKLYGDKDAEVARHLVIMKLDELVEKGRLTELPPGESA